MKDRVKSGYKYSLLALLVTFLWSTSWVLIKIGLLTIPPVAFAALRYSLASLILFALAVAKRQLPSLKRLSRWEVVQLILLGTLYYALTQGAQFIALLHLPAVWVSLFLNLTPALVLVFGVLGLKEKPSVTQIAGIGVLGLGMGLYFLPLPSLGQRLIGVIVITVGLLANAVAAVLGRAVNRRAAIHPLAVTTVTMAIGSVILLIAASPSFGRLHLTWTDWTIIGYLAVVNTALAFTLWNVTLRYLTAFESSIINSSMLIQIAILAWVFLGERLSLQQAGGVVAATIGVVLVTARFRRPRHGGRDTG